jgi:hypothetical protein
MQLFHKCRVYPYEGPSTIESLERWLVIRSYTEEQYHESI